MNTFEERLFARIDESWNGISTADLLAYLKPKTKEVITEDGLRSLLDEKRPLRIKLGIDPTASDVHLGHIVPILVLRQFLQAGHHIDLIIGDFTARIGDPSGRDTARTPLTKEKIEENQKTYREQIGKYIDINKISIHTNGTWLTKLPLDKFFSVLQSLSLAQATQRDDFRARAKNEQAVSLAEVCYGVLMGIDSVELKTDIELGGIDQLLNLQQCRDVMVSFGMKPEVVFTTSLIEGTSGDGKKMSKSYGNSIPVNASLDDKFGKVMSIPDKLIADYFAAFTYIKADELNELKKFIADNPLEAKKVLATLIVAWETRDLAKARAERERFEKKFSERTITSEDMITVPFDAGSTVIDALNLSGQFKSRTELRRLFTDNAVRKLDDEESVISLEEKAVDGLTLRAGKRRFFKLQAK
jgi:tyrosyl-tRNA synthetase